MIPGFTNGVQRLGKVDIAYSVGGSGPPVLLLHGFPQNRALWAKIAPALAKTRTVVCADLRGYGQSSKPDSVADYSFREMARDQLALMSQLGFESFDLVGHDRGGRTAHRMALDAPGRINSLCVMDIVPTYLLLSELTTPVAKNYYHWFFLAQPEPFPETMILADPDHFFQSSLLGWGAVKLSDIDTTQLDAYRTAWRDKDTIRGMCNDYRATIAYDFDLDAADLNRRIACPTLVMWGADGAMGKAYDVPATWKDRCSELHAQAMPGGHFFVDTAPDETTAALSEFLKTADL